MDTERWQQVQDLVDRALEIDELERAAFLEAACDGDPELRIEVESLIAVDLEAERLAGQPIFDLRRHFPPVRIGRHVGPYRIVEKIGEGGLGEVYLAERTEPFEQKVALKVIRGALRSEDVLRRFDLERQILADLDHPHIARLYDGGSTDDGLPYFVMEWIDGERLDRYCDAHKLPIEARLELFLDVCSAVEVAHRNLVVHRDLKPGNVLVTEDGVAKLLDFGIAKLLPRDGSADETLTRQGVSPMTRQYASPEQVTGQAITTASDVYSLGLILYELLTGHRPYRLEGCDTLEKLRRICEVEPPRPSTAVRRSEEVPTTAGRASITPETVSRNRSGTPERLRRRLAGDLDSILLKALRKQPENRYGSVEQLAGDIRRHLRGLPVLAREGTVLYRAGKYLRRHRWRLLAAAAVLAATAAVAAWQVRTAERLDRAVRAETETRVRETARTELLETLFTEADLDPPRRFTIRELLDRARARVEDTLSGGPRAAQLENLASIYSQLEFRDDAFELLTEVLRLYRELSPGDHPDVARALNNLAAWHYRAENHPEAERLYQESLDMRARLDLGDDELTVPMNNLATILAGRGEYAEAEKLYRRVLAIRRNMYGADHPQVAWNLRNLGNLLYLRGDFLEAEPLLRKAVEIRRGAFGARDLRTAAAGSTLARVLHGLGRHREAEDLLLEVLDVRLKLLSPDQWHVAVTRTDLAALRLDQGKDAIAAVLLDQALATLRTSRPGSAELAEAESLWGLYLMKAGRTEEAEPFLVDGYLGLREGRTPAAIQTRKARQRLIELYQTTGRPVPGWLETPDGRPARPSTSFLFEAQPGAHSSTRTASR